MQSVQNLISFSTHDQGTAIYQLINQRFFRYVFAAVHQVEKGNNVVIKNQSKKKKKTKEACRLIFSSGMYI